MLEFERDGYVLPTLLTRAAERFSEQPLVAFADNARTYAEADDVASRIANGLSAIRAGQGAKVAIMAVNSLAFVDAWLGAARAGAVYVPINTDYKGDILRYQLGKADVTHIVIDPPFLERLDTVAADLPKLTHVILSGAMTGAPRNIANGAVVSFIDELRHSPAIAPNVVVAPSDPLAISFTSGTTGPSKGVLASHSHVITFARDWIKACEFGSGQSIYSCLPLFHAVAAWLGLLPAMIAGGRITFGPRFSPSTYWDEVRRADADLAHGIFSMVPILLKQPPRPDDADQPARKFYFAQVNEDFEARFNCRIIEVYGATETGIVTATPPGASRRPLSCGKANDDTFEVMIANEHDEPVAAGEIGEILVRPRRPYSMLSAYYNNSEATAEAFRNFWFHTGDNARADEEGYLYFVDRKSDSIRRRGENISSSEVEAILNQHAAVLECAVIAVPAETGEDEVKAVIVLRPDAQAGAHELWEHCEQHMPRFWIPRFIEFRRVMPKTPSQKIQKYMLRRGEGQGEVHERPSTRSSDTA
ncbi:MAG: AMP-binding protein [Burkholderiaceae bacterium]